MTDSRNHAGRPRIVATTAGAPASVASPPVSATAHAAMAGATSGTTPRFTIGDTIASRPNDSSTTGSVAAWATSETARHSVSQPGSRGAFAASHAPNGVAQARIPAVASDDSWNPASDTRCGSTSSRRSAAQPSADAARPARPLSRATMTTPAIAAARTTDADAPANAT